MNRSEINRRRAVYLRWYHRGDYPRFTSLPPFLQKVLLTPYRGRRERFLIYLTFRANGFSELESKELALHYVGLDGRAIKYNVTRKTLKHMADIERQLKSGNLYRRYSIFDFHLNRFTRSSQKI
jgi:hypothetical protein